MDAADAVNPDAVRELRAEIVRAQTELQQTVAEIQERLSPAEWRRQARRAAVERVQHMTNHMGERMGHAADTTRQAAGTAVERVRRRPMPFALAGVAVGLTLAGRQLWRRRLHNGRGSESAWGGPTDAFGSSPAYGSSSGYGSGEYGGSTQRSNGPSARERVRERASRAADRVRGQWNGTLEDNPLALGLAAFALGALVGTLIPVSRLENDYLGQARDRVLESARSMAERKAEQLRAEASSRVNVGP